MRLWSSYLLKRADLCVSMTVLSSGRHGLQIRRHRRSGRAGLRRLRHTAAPERRAQTNPGQGGPDPAQACSHFPRFSVLWSRFETATVPGNFIRVKMRFCKFSAILTATRCRGCIITQERSVVGTIYKQQVPLFRFLVFTNLNWIKK